MLRFDSCVAPSLIVLKGRERLTSHAVQESPTPCRVSRYSWLQRCQRASPPSSCGRGSRGFVASPGCDRQTRCPPHSGELLSGGPGGRTLGGPHSGWGLGGGATR